MVKVRSAPAWPAHIERQLAKLTPDQAQMFGDLYQSTRRLEKWRGAERFGAKQALERLLINGTLTRKPDSQGHTLLENLVEMQTDPSIGKTYRRDLMGWTLAHLAFPKQSFNQVPDKGTCAPTVLAYDLALDAPAEFVRLVDGLAGSERAVAMANGELLERAAGTLQNGSRDGSPVERMLQASFMGFARPDDRYSLAEDAFQAGQDTGLEPTQVVRLVGALTGHPVETRAIDLHGLRALLKATNGRAPVVLRWSSDPEGKHSYHMVMATAVSAEHVYYRNPWGNRGDEDGTPDGAREVFKNGFERMTLGEFEGRLAWAVLPAGWTPPPLEPLLLDDPVKPEPARGFFGRLWHGLFG